MKTDFSLNVKIDIGLTPEVVALVNSIIGGRKDAAGKEPAAQQPEQKPEPEQQSEQKEKKTKQKPEQKAEPQPVQQPEQKAESERPKKLTAVDIREAIHKTRLRIEGEDYQNNTESDNYKKYHRTLTAAFKNIANILGSDKPSNLPEDKIQAFINECDQLEIQKDGTIGKSLAF